MPENNNIMSLEGQLIGMPTAGPESFSQQQLDYLKRALGVDETVLWDGNGTGSTSVTLSEAPTNFERLRLTVYRAEGTGTDSQFELYFPAATKYFELFISLLDNSETYRAEYLSRYQLSSLTLSLKACRHYYASVSSTSWAGTGNNQPISLLKVVGIHRIAGGN